MSIDQTWKLDIIVLDPGGANEAVLSQIEQRTVSAELGKIVGRPAGHAHIMFRAISTIQGAVSFTTTQIKTAIDRMGPTAICDIPADLYFKQADCQGSNRGSAIHKRLSASKCIMYWETLELPNSDANSLATMTCTLKPVFDGTNPLYTITENVICPGTLTFDEGYVVGEGYLDNVAIAGPPAFPKIGQIPGLQSITVNLNPTVKDKYASGESRASAVHVEAYEPSIEVSTLSALNFFRIPESGLCLDANGFVFFARRVEKCKERYANTENEHIRITCPEGLVSINNNSASGTDDEVNNFMVEPSAADDSSAELQIVVDQQIVAP